MWICIAEMEVVYWNYTKYSAVKKVSHNYQAFTKWPKWQRIFSAEEKEKIDVKGKAYDITCIRNNFDVKNVCSSSAV
jgi:hypothetical protein